MTISEFLFFHFFFSLISLFWYIDLILIALPGITYYRSKELCILLLLTCLVFGIIISFKKARNSRSVFLNISLGFEIFTIIAYYKYFATLIQISLTLSLIVGLLYSMMIIFRKIKPSLAAKTVIKNRIAHSLMASRTIFAIGTSTLTASTLLVTIFGYSIFQPASVAAINYSYLQDYTLEETLVQVNMLNQEIWQSLSIKERLDVLQTIANMERDYLGLPHELNIIAESMDEQTQGYYLDTQYLIAVNLAHIEYSPAIDVIKTVCHEAFHALQHREVELFNRLDETSQNLLLFDDTRQYKAEFANIRNIDSSKNFTEYYLQRTEHNARIYADEAVNRYMEMLD